MFMFFSMVNYQNIAAKLVTYLAITLINLAWIFPAAAITQDFQIKTVKGYRVESSFSYDETRSKETISEQAGENTDIVDFFQVRFYDPHDQMIASYDNIVDGVVQGNYFEFNYDPDTQQLLGKVDLGGESPGEIYLKGDADNGLTLIMVEPTGEEKVMDHGEWEINNY